LKPPAPSVVWHGSHLAASIGWRRAYVIVPDCSPSPPPSLEPQAPRRRRSAKG